jgi:sugar O-acyltransferase (sialic acid O-acetyltransferase NeuD family)
MSAVDFNRQVFEEDRVVCEHVQRGSSETDQQGMLSDEEARVGGFQRAYMEWFGDAVPYARRAVIMGAGDFGREVYGWLQDEAEHRGRPRDIVFANDDLTALDDFPELKSRLISTITDYQPLPTDDVFIAISKPASKLKLAESLRGRGAKFGTFIHRTALVEKSAELGEGCIICPKVVVSCRAKLGDFVSLNIASSVGHDARLGTATTLSAHADVTGHAVLGTGVFMGSHAVVLPKVKVGDYATIAAGSVAIRNVQPEKTVIGVPAKRLDMPAIPAKPDSSAA